MRHRYYAKTALVLFMSAGLTFHFVKLWITPSKQNLLTKKEDDDLFESEETAGWVVLPGNITVYGGKRNNAEVSLLTQAENLCRNFQDGRPKLLLFIPSHTDHFEKRRAIRETWGLRVLQQALNFRVAFILGVLSNASDGIVEKTQEEYHRFGDIIQLDLKEAYRNLGHKTLAGLRWSSIYCKNADFIMKADDDLLIQIPNLIKAVQSNNDTENLLLCRQNRRARIIRKSMDLVLPWLYKYQVNETELPGKFYPPYCSGMTYIFSKAVRDKLLEACSTTPVFFIEDVYLTGFCRHKAGIRITPHPGISLSPPMTPEQAVCAFKDGRLTSQELSPDELRRLWDGINTQGFFCPELLGYLRTQVGLVKVRQGDAPLDSYNNADR